MSKGRGAGTPFPHPSMLEVSPELLACLHLQSLSSPLRKAQQLQYLQAGMVPSTAHLLRVPCLGLHLPRSDSVLGQLPHPGVLSSLGAPGLPQTLPSLCRSALLAAKIAVYPRKGQGKTCSQVSGLRGWDGEWGLEVRKFLPDSGRLRGPRQS